MVGGRSQAALLCSLHSFYSIDYHSACVCCVNRSNERTQAEAAKDGNAFSKKVIAKKGVEAVFREDVWHTKRRRSINVSLPVENAALGFSTRHS